MPTNKQPNKSQQLPNPPTEMMQRKPKVAFTPERKEVFLDKLREVGLIYIAAAHAGVSSVTVAEHLKRDPVFAELYHEAKEYHTDLMLAEATRRAMEGEEEPVIGGKDRDEVVATIVRRSDRLMEFVVKARREEYRHQGKVEAAVSGGIMVLPATQGNPRDWEQRYGDAARGTTGRPESEEA